jgi:hypothetical protein
LLLQYHFFIVISFCNCNMLAQSTHVEYWPLCEEPIQTAYWKSVVLLWCPLTCLEYCTEGHLWYSSISEAGKSPYNLYCFVYTKLKSKHNKIRKKTITTKSYVIYNVSVTKVHWLAKKRQEEDIYLTYLIPIYFSYMFQSYIPHSYIFFIYVPIMISVSLQCFLVPEWL